MQIPSFLTDSLSSCQFHSSFRFGVEDGGDP
jgi:hypothetical protein